MEISVIIATRNRAQFLEKCLISLCRQTISPDRYEICVVNNGSDDNTAEVVGKIINENPAHRIFLIDEGIVGLSSARNAGIRNTTAPLIANGDDDATMPSDWLERFLAVYSEKGERLGKIGGDINPVWGAPRPEWLVDEMLPLFSASAGQGGEPKFVDEGILEGNSCYRRKALVEAGGFPSQLGHKGSNLLSAENMVDIVMYMAGWQIYFDPSIKINHYIHADRLTPSWIRKRYFWQGVSDYVAISYLKTKGIETTRGFSVDMPLDISNWTFVNNKDEPPEENKLKRLRSLGFVLALSGLVSVQ